jgi:hypothetical protein
MNIPAPSPDAQFSALLARFPVSIVALVEQSLPKLRHAIPYSHQVVYEYPNSVVASLGMSEKGYEAIVALAILPDAVKLYFDRSLPDPKRLLEGSGSKVRSLTLGAASDLDDADIKALIAAALARLGAGFPRTGAIRTIIKPTSRKSGAKGPKPRTKKSQKSTAQTKRVKLPTAQKTKTAQGKTQKVRPQKSAAQKPKAQKPKAQKPKAQKPKAQKPKAQKPKKVARRA